MAAFFLYTLIFIGGMKRRIRLTQNELHKIIFEGVKRALLVCENNDKPSEEEYRYAKAHIYDDDHIKDYDYLNDIIERYEKDDNLYDKLVLLSVRQFNKGLSRNSEFICTNGKLINLHCHASVSEIGLNADELIEEGFIRIIGGYYSNYVYVELAKYPNEKQENTLLKYIGSCYWDVYVDITHNRKTIKHFVFDRKTFSADLILKKLANVFN